MQLQASMWPRLAAGGFLKNVHYFLDGRVSFLLPHLVHSAWTWCPQLHEETAGGKAKRTQKSQLLYFWVAALGTAAMLPPHLLLWEKETLLLFKRLLTGFSVAQSRKHSQRKSHGLGLNTLISNTRSDKKERKNAIKTHFKNCFDFLEVYLSTSCFTVIAFTVPQSSARRWNNLQLPWDQNSFTRAACREYNSFSKADSEDDLRLLTIADLPDPKKLGEESTYGITES